MKKHILLIILAIAMLVLLCGCSGMDKIEKIETNYGTRFKIIEEYYNGTLVVDTKTKVEYWISSGSYNSGNLTLLVDANGNPCIFEED